MIRPTVLKTRVPRKNLLLAELIIVLFFFSLAAAGCITLFGKAYTNVNNSRELTAAAIEAQNTAEIFKAASGNHELMVELMGHEVQIAGNGNKMFMIVIMDESGFVPSRERYATIFTIPEKDFYVSILTTEEGNGLITAMVGVTHVSSNEVIYELDVATVRGRAQKHEQ